MIATIELSYAIERLQRIRRTGHRIRNRQYTDSIMVNIKYYFPVFHQSQHHLTDLLNDLHNRPHNSARFKVLSDNAF
jgi:hypothetical protein